METPREQDLDKMTEAKQVELFLVQFWKFYARPKSEPNLPKESTKGDNTSMEDMIRILSKWQSVHKINVDPSLEGSAANGRYWSQMIANSAIIIGHDNLLTGVAKCFEKMKNDIMYALDSMDMDDLKEHDLYGHCSWLHALRMDYQFFNEAGITLVKIFREKKNNEQRLAAMRREAGYGQILKPVGGTAGGPGGGLNVAKGGSVEGGFKPHAVGKVDQARESVTLSGGMVGAPGSIGLMGGFGAFGGVLALGPVQSPLSQVAEPAISPNAGDPGSEEPKKGGERGKESSAKAELPQLGLPDQL